MCGEQLGHKNMNSLKLRRLVTIISIKIVIVLYSYYYAVYHNAKKMKQIDEFCDSF